MGDLITVGDQSVLGDLKQLAKAIQDLGWAPPPPEGQEVILPYQEMKNKFLIDQEIVKGSSDSSVYLHLVTPVKNTHNGNIRLNIDGTYYTKADTADYFNPDALVYQASLDLDYESALTPYSIKGTPIEGTVIQGGESGVYFTSYGSLAIRMKSTSDLIVVRALVSLVTIGSSQLYTSDDFAVVVSADYAL